MLKTEPPAIATWMLQHFGSSPNNAELMGDLDERYRQGRSRTWYWRQASAAIVVSFLKEVWAHKLLTVRAIFVGWSVFVVSRYGFNLTRELLFALASWSRFWRGDWITIAVQTTEVVLAGVAAGWLVARLHRQSQKAMVLAYAVYFAGVQIVWLTTDLLRGAPLQFLIYAISFTPMMDVGILVGGGLFSTRTNRDASEHTSAAIG